MADCMIADINLENKCSLSDAKVIGIVATWKI